MGVQVRRGQSIRPVRQSAVLTLKQVENAAEVVLAKDPEPVVKARLLREVLVRPADDSEYLKAKADARESKWVRQLEEAQCDDGSWGRFHTENTKARSTFPTKGNRQVDYSTRVLALLRKYFE